MSAAGLDQYGGQWITLKHVRQLLGLTASQSKHKLRDLPHREAARIPGVGGRRPMMFRLEDIRRIKQVIDATGMPLAHAVRLRVAEVEGRV